MDQMLENTADQEVYTSSTHGFSITPPTTWLVNETPPMGLLVMFSNPHAEQENNATFTANITISSSPAEETTLDQVTQEALQMLDSMLQDYQTVPQEPAEVSDVFGLPAKIVGGTFTQGVFSIRNIQLLVLTKGVLYIVSGTALASTWDQYEEILKSALLSFSFNEITNS